jgi:hypothetical protein
MTLRRCGVSSRGFLDFPGAQAARADLHPPGATRCLHPHALQIRVPAAIGEVVGVADIVAVAWPFTTDVTAFSHGSFLIALKAVTGPGALLQYRFT